ncbi:MAG: hypothetical protein WC360_01625 [Opitutales bacterium]|jgi:hypothetical protein
MNNLSKLLESYSDTIIRKTKRVYDEREEIIKEGIKIASSVKDGCIDFGKGMAGNFILDDKLKILQKDIENQGVCYREVNRTISNRFRRGDALMLAGEFFHVDSLPDKFSGKIESAYQSLFLHDSGEHSLRDEIANSDQSELNELVTKIKKKLFETKYTEYLNNGHMPEGYSASIASSTTHTGHALSVSGPDNEVAHLIQTKAEASISYINEALGKYPDIDVVTANDVYAQMSMHGISDGLALPDISSADLIGTVANGVGSDDITMDCVPSIITLAMIAFTSYNTKSLNAFQKAELTGGRIGKNYMAYLLGSSVAALTNVWWLGLASSVISRYIAEPGRRTYELNHELQALKQYNQTAIDRLRTIAQSD